ncbi:hypothetical protein [Microcoleus sp. D2_18a_D3]
MFRLNRKNIEVEINQQKEQFSNIYLQAVTTVAGYSLYKPFGSPEFMV